MNKVMNAVSDYIREDLPNFRSGDTVNVGVKVVEGSKSCLLYTSPSPRD